MGSGSFDSRAWGAYSSSVRTKSVDAIYTSKFMAVDSKLNPKGISVRESRDSPDNPESTAIIVAIDVTGSMHIIAEEIAKRGLGTLFQEILDRKPVTNPHLMFMAVGDVRSDMAPLQVSQFEADNRIIEQLTQIWIEHGGGGNKTESYDLPWYFAAKKTSIDCMEKRNKKGYLFTIGDEDAPCGIDKKHFKEFLGVQEDNLSAKELLAMAEQKYNVFHIHIEQGHGNGDLNTWNNLMGQHVLPLSDYTKLSETIVSTIQVVEGASKSDVSKSWDGSTNVVVSKAIMGLENVKTETGVVVL